MGKEEQVARKDWYYVNLPSLVIKRLDQFLETPRAKSIGMSGKSELLRHIVNEFLDEQERHYGGMESIQDFILTMKDRDHVIVTFNEDSQLKEILTAFLKRGVDNNYVSVIFTSKQDEAKVVNAIGGMDQKSIHALFNAEDLWVVRDEDCRGSDGAFSPELAQKGLSRVAESARKRGRSGLNVVGTVPGKMVHDGSYDDAVSMEKSFHALVQRFNMPISVICMYRSLPDEVQGRFLECHDLVIKRAVTVKESGLL